MAKQRPAQRSQAPVAPPNVTPAVVKKISVPPPSPNRPSVGGAHGHPNPGVSTTHGGPETDAASEQPNEAVLDTTLLIEQEQPYRH